MPILFMPVIDDYVFVICAIDKISGVEGRNMGL